jgi:hypothetical protein
MTPQDLAADLRTRINPLYATQPGTESYERRLCAEAIEGLLETVAERDAEIEQLKSIAYSDDGAGGEGMKLFLQVRAQRKVLEQALGALADQDTDSQTRRHRRTETITAIQEVLSK